MDILGTILTVDLDEEAKNVLKEYEDYYGTKPTHIDQIQESKVYEYAAHEYEEYLYAEIKKQLENQEEIRKESILQEIKELVNNDASDEAIFDKIQELREDE